MDKDTILGEIKRIAVKNGDAPGREVFERETGIRVAEWYPRLWLRWGDALQEAGYPPKRLQGRLSHDELIQRYAEFVRELGRIPVAGEMRRRAADDPLFPSHSVFGRFGGKDRLLEAVVTYCRTVGGFDDVAALCGSGREANSRTEKSREPKVATGFVYLMKSGKHYKIGYTKSVGRRGSELAIKIPVPPTTVHTIETDDPAGVESYWHKRFSDKRGEGEWFDLAPEDIKAFRRWRRIV